MSLKVGFIIFYVCFLGVFVFLTNSFGVTALNITQEQLGEAPIAPPNPDLLGSLTFLLQIAVFGIETFGFLLTVSTSILLLSIAIFVPLTFGLAWAISELARGN